MPGLSGFLPSRVRDCVAGCRNVHPMTGRCYYGMKKSLSCVLRGIRCQQAACRADETWYISDLVSDGVLLQSR